MGWIRFSDEGKKSDCIASPNTAHPIPVQVEEVKNILSFAEYILVVEKESVFQRLANDQFCSFNRCIVITVIKHTHVFYILKVSVNCSLCRDEDTQMFLQEDSCASLPRSCTYLYIAWWILIHMGLTSWPLIDLALWKWHTMHSFCAYQISAGLVLLYPTLRSMHFLHNVSFP